jgi:hypothetical protein
MCLCCFFQYVSARTQSGRITVGDLPPIFKKLKIFAELFTEDEIKAALAESYQNMDDEIDFESFLRVSPYLFLCSLYDSSALEYVCWFLSEKK